MRSLLFAFLASALLAQTPGTITVATTITAVAGNLTCAAVPSGQAITVTCGTLQQPTAFQGTYTISPGSTDISAAVVTYKLGANSVTWMLYQPVAAGPISWQVAANGVAKQGQF